MSDRDERRAAAESITAWERWSLLARGRVPPSWLTHLRSDPLLRRTRVVADLVVGRSARITAATTGLAATSLDGRRISANSVLATEPDLDDSINPGDAQPVARRVSLSVDGQAVRPSAVLATGWPMAGRGEVSLLADGMQWEDRLVHVRGPLTGGVQFGIDKETVSLSVSDPSIASTEIPPWIIDTTRFSGISGTVAGEEYTAQANGQRIPICVGSAKRVPCPRVDLAALGVDHFDLFLVSYGRTTVSSVWVDGVLASSGYTAIQTTDAQGLPVTVLSFTVGAADQTSQVYATFSESDPDVDRSLIASIAMVLRDFAKLGSDRISDRLIAEAGVRYADVGASPSGRSSPRWFLNRPTSVMNAITELLAEYPMVSMAWDGPALGPVVVDHRADPVAILVSGTYPVLGRAKGAQYEERSSAEWRTRFAIRYDYDALRDLWGGIDTRDGDTSTLCAMALQALDGVDQPMDQVDALTIGDAATAASSLDWWVEHLARPSWEVAVDCYPEVWLTLRVGDPVRWTDAAMGLTAEEAVVVGRRWHRGDDGPTVELTLWVWPAFLKRTGTGGGSRSFSSS